MFPRDARDQAFDVLLPLTTTIEEAIASVDRDVADDRKLTGPLRAQWLRGQRTGTSGGVRFNSATHRLGQAFEGRSDVKRTSTVNQQARNIFLWLVADSLTLRIKRHPEEIVDPGAATLFSLAPSVAVQTAFLCWGIGEDGKIDNPMFVTVDEPRWSIPLWELSDAAIEPVQPIAPVRVGGPEVRSAKRSAPGDIQHG